jgi:hypothetical protein
VQVLDFDVLHVRLGVVVAAHAELGHPHAVERRGARSGSPCSHDVPVDVTDLDARAVESQLAEREAPAAPAR